MKKTMQSLVFSRHFLFLCSLILLISCNRNEEPITIHFFKADSPAIPASVDKNEEDGWKPLLNVDLSQSDLVINEDNIVNYELEAQKFIFDSELKDSFGYDKLPLDYYFFVLALGKSPVVGGILLDEISAVGSRIPVLYISISSMYPNNPGIEMYLKADGYITTPDDPEFFSDIHNRLLKIGKLIEE